MKKSSLGRRSSVMSVGRLSVVDKNVSRFGDGKKSLLPKPCSANKGGRASSVERDMNVSIYRRDPPSTLQRSKSYVNLDFKGTSTPCFTPQQLRNTASMYSKLQLSEGGNRSSSVGGLKSAKKESRPVTEKSFQAAAQQKIQQFFVNRAPQYLEKGSIKPMSSTMFVDLVNFLMTKFDRTIELNKSNLIDGVLQICKVLNYRGKAEKSWLRTVNTPHSWPHVVSFLVWLVELYEVSDSLQVYEAMYPENVEDEVDVNDIDFRVLVPYLMNGYRRFQKNEDDSEDMKQFLLKHKQASNIDEEDIDLLQNQYAHLQSELNNSEDIVEEEQLKEKIAILEAVRRDIQKTRDFIYQTEQYVDNLNEKHKAKVATFQDYENRIKDLTEEKRKLQESVSQQEMSQDKKKEIEMNLALLQREIQQLNETVDEYKNEVYKEDLKLVNVKTAFNKHIQGYNKEIIVNLAVVPELKIVQIEDTSKLLADTPESQQPFQHIDDRLVVLKTQLKKERLEVDTEIEKIKLQIQKKEDELAQEEEKFENLEKEYTKLNNEYNQLRKSVLNDKETKRLLAKIEEDIERERKKIESIGDNEENELATLENKKKEKQKEYDDYVNTTGTELQKKLDYLKEMDAKFKEVTKRKMEEREAKINELYRGKM